MAFFFRKYRDELRFDLYWLINNLMFVSVQRKYSNFNSYLKVWIFKNGFIMITYTLNNGLFQFRNKLYIQYFDFVNVQIWWSSIFNDRIMWNFNIFQVMKCIMIKNIWKSILMKLYRNSCEIRSDSRNKGIIEITSNYF